MTHAQKVMKALICGTIKIGSKNNQDEVPKLVTEKNLLS